MVLTEFIHSFVVEYNACILLLILLHGGRVKDCRKSGVENEACGPVRLYRSRLG